jgi:outer membrane protein assembly factor BamA
MLGKLCARQVACAALVAFVSAATLGTSFSNAQTAPAATAQLREVRSDGLKTLTEAQVAALSGLQTGAQVSRDDLQAAADKLLQTGLFANVKYNFQTRVDGLLVTFHVEEAQRGAAYFDNIPWFADSELNDAIRSKLPFYDGTLPAAGSVVEQASGAISAFLVVHGLQAAIEHQVLANPNGEGTIQQFHIEGGSLKILSVEFSDPALNTSNAIQQSLGELKGKPYSRMAIDLFLTEQVRPIYQKQGYLRAKLGPPEVRLTGNPNKKLPEQIPVFVPITPGPVYRWKGTQWIGNSALSESTLTGDLGMKAGDVVDGMALEAGLDRVREEYGHVGYLDAKVDPAPAFDDQAHTLSYTVKIEEGKSYKFGGLVITGLSVAGEKRLRDSWPIPQNELFDKNIFEDFLTKLEAKPGDVFKDLPVHYDNVGHWLRPDEATGTVDVLLDFK